MSCSWWVLSGYKTSDEWPAIISNSLLHSTQTDAPSNHSRPAFFVVDSLVQILQWDALRTGLFVGQKSGSSTGLLHYCTFGLEAANNAQNVRVDSARRKDNDQQNLSKMITWYCSVYNQMASEVWRYNNPVYKLTTNKLQLVLINVLLRIFEP